ncbi:MAG: hypothetical protein KTR30_30790 [Saprospiraceae bacterium]|nr:hypothetical protein [Saprospiraceae bacterium]
MESRQSFNVDHAIKQWLFPLRSSGVFTKDNLQELACHVRDSYDSSAFSGLSEEIRFQNTVQQFGSRTDLIVEYKKNNQSSIAKEYCLYLLMGAIGSFGLFMIMKLCFAILCKASIYAGLSRSNLALVTWGSAILIYAFWTYQGWIFFKTANKPRKFISSKIFRVSRQPVLMIAGFLTLVYVSHMFLSNWMRHTSNAHIPDLQLVSVYQDVRLIFLTGIPVWWLFILLAWSVWLYGHSTKLNNARLFRNNKSVSFLAGGIIALLSFILFTQTKTGIPMLFLSLDLSQDVGNFILQCLFTSVVLFPFILYGICHFYPQSIVKIWHLEVSSKVYKYLTLAVLATLLLYFANLYVFTWIKGHKDILSQILNARYKQYSSLLIIFWLSLLILPVTEYSRRSKKGYLIETEAS